MPLPNHRAHVLPASAARVTHRAQNPSHASPVFERHPTASDPTSSEHPLANHRPSALPASVAPARSRVTHRAPKTPPMRHPFSTDLRNSQKPGNLDRYQKMRTHTASIVGNPGQSVAAPSCNRSQSMGRRAPQPRFLLPALTIKGSPACGSSN